MFVRVIEAVPKQFEINGPDPDFSISIPVSVSDDGVRCVTLEVRLIPKSFAGVGVHELKFLFVVENSETGEIEEIYGRDEAAAYVQPAKDLIMDCVCEAVTVLVQEIQPSIIFRATFATRPPDKALPKHQMITDIIQKLGYEEPWVGTDDYQRVRWVMKRTTERKNG